MNQETQVVNLSVAAAYDRWADQYDGYDNPMLRSLELVQRQFPNDLRDKRVFEFGCGTGRNLVWAASRGAAQVGGCDLSEGMLAKARARLPHAQLLVRDMNDPIPEMTDGSIDQVLFCLTLEHLDALDQPLREARRMLAAGGRITIAEIHPFLALGGGKAHFKDGDEEVHMPTVAHRFADYLNAFNDTGLSVIHAREIVAHEITDDPNAKVMKRGPKTPMMVVFHLAERS